MKESSGTSTHSSLHSLLDISEIQTCYFIDAKKLNMAFYYFYRMSFEDLMDNFKSINICHLSPGNMSINVVS